MGSIRHVTHHIPFIVSEGIAGAAIAGFTFAIVGAIFAAVHPVTVKSEGPDKCIHVVLHPPRQVASNGHGHRSNDSVKDKVRIPILKVAEDTR